MLCGTSGKKELCMVPCHSCHIYGIWTSRSKKVWEMLKCQHFGVVMQVTKGGFFHRQGRISLCNTAVLWNFIAIFTGYILWKILSDVSFHYTTVVLRVWVWQHQKCDSKSPNDTNTKWAIPEKILSFLLYPWKLQTKQGFTPRSST